MVKNHFMAETKITWLHWLAILKQGSQSVNVVRISNDVGRIQVRNCTLNSMATTSQN